MQPHRLLHANGFPAGTYRVLFEAWRAAGWRVLALTSFGPRPALPRQQQLATDCATS
jgi:hypothetical protein